MRDIEILFFVQYRGGYILIKKFALNAGVKVKWRSTWFFF